MIALSNSRVAEWSKALLSGTNNFDRLGSKPTNTKYFLLICTAHYGEKIFQKHASFENAYTHKGSCGFSGLKSENFLI